MKDTTNIAYYPYPDHNIAFDKKDKDWHLKWCQAIYGNFIGAGSRYWLWNAKPLYTKLRSYANGKQDPNEYRKQIDCLDENHQSIINKNFRWDIVPFLPKFRNIVVSKILKNGSGVSLNRLDSLGVSEKREFQAKLEAQIYMQDFVEYVKDALGVDLSEQIEDAPVDMDEVENYMESEYKDNLCMAFESALNLEMNWNNFLLVRKQMIGDWVDVGVGGCKTGTLQNGKPFIRYVKPDNLIVSAVQKEDFSDLTHIGEFRLLTLQELIYEAGNALSTDEIQAIVEMYGTRREDVPINYNTNEGLTVKQEYRIPVLDCEWYSVHRNDFTKSLSYPAVGDREAEENDRKGESKPNELDRKRLSKVKSKNAGVTNDKSPSILLNEISTRKNELLVKETESETDDSDEELDDDIDETEAERSETKGKKEKTKKNDQQVTYRVIHKASYVLGTNCIYNWGLKNDMVRTYDDPSETRLSYHLFAPNMIQGSITSLVTQLVTLADMLQLTWLRLQQALTQMNPFQVAIDIDAITNLSIDFGGSAIKPKEVLDLFFKKGVLTYSGETIRDNPNAKPIYEIPNSAEKVVMSFYNLINGFLNLIREVSGINGVVDASTPTTDMLVGVQKQALAATNDALEYLYQADLQTLLNMSKDMVERIADNIRYYDGERYYEAIGEQTVEFIRKNSDKALPVFGIVPEKKITDEQRQEVIMMAQSAMSNGQIDYEDYFAISNAKSFKQAQRLLAIRTKRKMRKAEQMQQKQMEMNAQVQMQSNEQATQMRLQEAQMLSELKMQEASSMLELELKKLEIMQQYQERMALIQRETELLKLKLKGEIDENLLEEETKADLITQDMKGKYELQKQSLSNQKQQNSSIGRFSK